MYISLCKHIHVFILINNRLNASICNKNKCTKTDTMKLYVATQGCWIGYPLWPDAHVSNHKSLCVCMSLCVLEQVCVCVCAMFDYCVYIHVCMLSACRRHRVVITSKEIVAEMVCKQKKTVRLRLKTWVRLGEINVYARANSRTQSDMHKSLVGVRLIRQSQQIRLGLLPPRAMTYAQI